MSLNVLGFDEYWTMFSNPSRGDEYLRVTYLIGPSEGVTRTVTELVLPAHPEYRIRGLESFRASYQDRALNTALLNVHGEAPSELSAPHEDESGYLPLARYFAQRYERTNLPSHERIHTVEVWHGVVPNQPPGFSTFTPPERIDLLRDYYSGPIEHAVSSDSLRPVEEREGDIVWRREFRRPR